MEVKLKMKEKCFIVGYKVYGESSCDVVKVFNKKENAEKFANSKNNGEDPKYLGYIVKEFDIDTSEGM